MKDDLQPIYDLVSVARCEAQIFYSLSHVDDTDELVNAAHNAFNALADAIAALLRLVEARAEDAADPLAADRRDPLWEEAEAALTAMAHALLDEQHPDDDDAEDEDEDEQEMPALVVYIASELEKLQKIAGEWLDGYEQLRSPDESDARDVLECLEEHQAMIGRSHYLAMSLINMRLNTVQTEQPDALAQQPDIDLMLKRVRDAQDKEVALRRHYDTPESLDQDDQDEGGDA